MKVNNTNDFSKRTASQVNSILKANGIIGQVFNLGDNKEFELRLEPEIKTLMKLKMAGFLRTGTTSKSIYFKTF